MTLAIYSFINSTLGNVTERDLLCEGQKLSTESLLLEMAGEHWT